MARKTKEEAEKTYHLLLDGATECFTERGVAKTTLNDIAKRVGLTRGAVYWHFENKEQVIKALWQRNAGHLHQQLIDTLIPKATPLTLDIFRQTLESLVKTALNDEKFSQAIRIVTSSQEFTDEQSELEAFLLARKNEMFDAFAHALKYLKNSGEITTDESDILLTTSLWVTINGLMHTDMQLPERALNIKQHSTELLEFWFKGLLPNKY